MPNSIENESISVGDSFHDYFATDTVASVYNEIAQLKGEILKAARQIEFYGTRKSHSKAEYEQQKNIRLLQMFSSETSGAEPKRTEKHRQAIYRNALQKERLEMQVDEMMYDASKEYLKGLESSLTAAQTRMRILEKEKD